MKTKKDLIQLRNPVTKRWAVVDRATGSIIKHSHSRKPYKNIPIHPDYQKYAGDTVK